jgi:PAS domain S-box-containing protein
MDVPTPDRSSRGIPMAAEPPDFRELFEAVPGLYLVLLPDPARTIAAVSTAYLRATMTERDAILGRGLFEVFPDNPDDSEASGVRNLAASIERVILHRVPDAMAVQKYDIRRPAEEGGGFEERWWSPQNSPVLGPDGSVRYVIHRVEDVTDYIRLKQTGAELQSRADRMEAEVFSRAQELQQVNAKLRGANDEITRLYEQAKELDQLKTDFFATVSHELRTPLTLILGPAERMRAAATAEGLQRELDVVARNARLLLRHVNDLLDLQKLEATQTRLEHADADLAHLVRLVAGSFETAAQDAHMELVIVAPPVLAAQVDPGRFGQIVLNLISNAFKFTPPGGRVRITLRATGERAVLEVADSGPGIAPEHRALVFERFRQLEGGTTRRLGGTGLGLAITKNLVELHGGSIAIAGAPEGGALFVVELPRMAPAGTELAPPSEPDLAARAQRAVEAFARPAPTDDAIVGPPDAPLVLVVEDNPDMSRFVVEGLAEHYRVARALDGTRGLQLALELRPDLVISDIMLPGMGGDALLRALRSHSELDHTLVVLASARADDALRLRLLAEGAHDYITKPFSLEELRIRVDNLLAGRRVTQDETVSALVRSAVDGIVTMDEHGIIRSFNPAAERMFGYAAHEVIGRNVRMLMPSPHREHHSGYLARYLAEGFPRIIGIGRALEGVSHDGRAFPMHLAVSELWIGGRRMFAGFVRDMTVQKQLEEQLRHSQKMEAIGALTSGIAHDFGNLLMGIAGCANIALDKVDLDHPVARYLRELSAAAKRGTDLTRQLLGFSRKQAPKLASVVLDALIEGCAGLLRRLVGDDIVLEIRSAAPRCSIVADAGQLEQILVNLVVNARDAMPAGGRITITTAEVVIDERSAEARGLAAGRYVKLEVTDDGHGMDEATRLRVFEPFFTTKEVGKGTGLGLSTVYALTKQFHGGLGVQSKLGRGTTFTLCFPCQAAPATAEARDGAPELLTGNETVLIVDDDRLVRLSVRHYLEGLGYRVVEALEPGDALQLSREPSAAFDLLLTDVVMPGIGGRSLAERVRELHPEIRVLFMSAHPIEELLARGSLQPGDDLLDKPFGQAQLATAVRRVLDADQRPGVAHEAAAGPPPERTSSPASVSPASVLPASVLLVEDEAAARMVVAELLEELGHRIFPAATAAEALAIVEGRTERVDLVLTDISLPDMRGTRLVQRIRAMLPEVSVIYMSGYDGTDVPLGPNDGYLTKPFDFDDLLRMVEDGLRRARGG